MRIITDAVRQAAIATRPGRCLIEGTLATMFLLIVQKMRQALTFLATIENHDRGMKTLAVISLLALLTISGAAYTDRLLTSDRLAVQAEN